MRSARIVVARSVSRSKAAGNFIEMPQSMEAGLGARQNFIRAERAVPNTRFVYSAVVRQETARTIVVRRDKQIVRRRQPVLESAAGGRCCSLLDAIQKQVNG